MQIHSKHHHPRPWLTATVLSVLTLALVRPLASTEASPVPQAIFQSGHRGQHKHFQTESATILDILGERPEFSKLLELIQKDKDLTKLLADPTTQPTLFAPTNDAFDSISDVDYPTRDVLMYHIASKAYNSTSLHEEAVIKSLYESPGLDNSAQLLRISLENPGIPSTSMKNSLWREEPEVWIADMDESESRESALYINRAKVILSDMVSQSGGVVHGVNRIIKPPGPTILDEVMRRGMHFTYLTKAWTETGIDAHVRDGKSLTLFAAHDKAWKALPKKLVRWLFSAKGKEHLKIFAMYQIANRALYTPEIFNRSLEDGTPSDSYADIVLQTLLHSPKYELHVQGQPKRMTQAEAAQHSRIDYKPKGLTDLIEAFKGRWKSVDLIVYDDPVPMPPSPPDNKTDHHYPHHDPNHPHHHRHRHGKHHRHRHHRHHRDKPHHGGDHEGGEKPHPHPAHRDEILVNDKARFMHGYENWIAGNGVIHVVDKVLMPPRSKGCQSMSAMECSVWETLWDLGNVDLETVVNDVVSWYDDLSLFDAEDESIQEEEEEEEEEQEEEQGRVESWFEAEDEDEE